MSRGQGRILSKNDSMPAIQLKQKSVAINIDEDEIKRASKYVKGLVSSVKALKNNGKFQFGSTANIQINGKILKQKRQLDDLRLKNETQDTQLLKIQQKERQVGDDYKQKKQVMEQTLANLASEAEEFNIKQKQMHKQLEVQKDTIVIQNDLKKKNELDQKEKDTKQIIKFNIEIQNKKKLVEQKTQELNSLKDEIQKYMKFQNFLKEVHKQVKEQYTNQDQKEEEPRAEFIIEDYTQRKKEIKRNECSGNIDEQKRTLLQQMSKCNAQIDDDTLSFTSKMNILKKEIDVLNEENRQLSAEIEGKQNQHYNTLMDRGKIILAIKNMYQEYAQDKEIEKIQKDTTSSLKYKLIKINQKLQEMKQLKQLYEEQQKGKDSNQGH